MSYNHIYDSLKPEAIYSFAKESNEIENIRDKRRHLNHAAALEKFLELPKIEVHDLIEFVKAIEPEAYIRTCDAHQVWIGGHEAMAGSKVLNALQMMIESVHREEQPNSIHKIYENIHPFIDGNGRSGRALWLWQMVNQCGYDGRYKFLRMYYYLTLG